MKPPKWYSANSWLLDKIDELVKEKDVTGLAEIAVKLLEGFNRDEDGKEEFIQCVFESKLIEDDFFISLLTESEVSEEILMLKQVLTKLYKDKEIHQDNISKLELQLFKLEDLLEE